MMATVARQIVATFKNGGRPCRQSHHVTAAFTVYLHNSPLYPTVYIHAALGGGGHRLQPLNVAVLCHIGYMLVGEGILAGGNGDTAESCNKMTAVLVLWLWELLAVVQHSGYGLYTLLDYKLCG
jgi:hypothetical protein